MASNYPPKFTRHQQDWNYSISNRQRVDLKCNRNNSWVTTSLQIHGNGILRNVNSCYIVGQSFQLYPTVQGCSSTTVTRGEPLLIQHVDPISVEEQEILLNSPKPDTTELDQISAGVDKMQLRNLDNIFQIHERNVQRTTQYYSYLYVLIPSLVIALVVKILCYGKPFWITYITQILPCTTKNPQNPKPHEISPVNPRKKAEAETEGPGDARTSSEAGETQFLLYGTQSTA
jgi:hypothetical protein